MATPSSQSLIMAADPAAIMDVIADFESYPKWTGSIKNVTVTVPGADGAPAQQVAFSMDAGLVKDNYELAYTWADDGLSVSWKLVSGQMQKAQQGSYVLKVTPEGHRGHLHAGRRPGGADDRRAPAQGRAGHPGHRAQGVAQESRGRMRIALHTGKGGVGKTTISAATAIACATGGARTLLVSTDPAHSTADVLGVAVHADPTQVPGVPNLWAAQVDTRGRFEQSWSHIRGYLVGVLAARGMAEVQAEELTVLPGAEEIVALLELRRLAESGDFDAIIVDCAPTGETLRLLALPETVGFYAQRLLGAPQRVLRSIAASLTGLPGGAPNATVRDALGDLLAELMAARALLADPAITGVRLVLTPERVVIAEARRLFTALSLHGFRVEAVTVNRVLPPNVGGEFLRRQREGQREAMTQVEESFQDLPIRRVLQIPVEPIGVQRLSELATDMFGDRGQRRRSTGEHRDADRDRGQRRGRLVPPRVAAAPRRARRHRAVPVGGRSGGDGRRRAAADRVAVGAATLHHRGGELRAGSADDRLRRRSRAVAGGSDAGDAGRCRVTHSANRATGAATGQQSAAGADRRAAGAGGRAAARRCRRPAQFDEGRARQPGPTAPVGDPEPQTTAGTTDSGTTPPPRPTGAARSAARCPARRARPARCAGSWPCCAANDLRRPHDWWMGR